jgi:DNA-binding CsgD family transcriptional regulator
MARLAHRDLRSVSESICLLYQSSELESFPRQVFAAVKPLVRCDLFAYNEFDRSGALQVVHCEPGLPESATQFLTDIGPDFSKEHPTVSYIGRTADPRPFKITDFTSQRQWRQTRLYHDFYQPLKCEYQMAFASPTSSGQMALAFNATGRDFSDEDRQVLELLRPHLMQAHANAQLFTRITAALRGIWGAYLSAAADGTILYATGEALQCLERHFGATTPASLLPPRLRNWLIKSAQPHLAAQPLVLDREGGQLRITLASRERDGTCNLLLEEKLDTAAAERLIELGLTPREAEVLIWVARGKATSEIATILDCKAATVSKHLDHIYHKLGVENRTAAAAYVTGL